MSIFKRKVSGVGRRAVPVTASAYRRLAAESLEDRALLAGDLASFQNHLLNADVNADGDVNFNDAFAVLGELRSGGARSLTASGGGAEGEGGSGTSSSSTMFVDVNGDDYLSMQDILSVVGAMRGEAAAGDVSVRLETAVGGVAASTVGTNQPFTLNVYVQDNRTEPGLTPADLGVLSAELDVLFDVSLVSPMALGITPGPFYDDLLNTPSASDEAVGLVDNSLLLQTFSAVPEQQSLTITGGAAGDDFTLTVNLNSGASATTGAIAFDADAAAVQTAVDTALAGIAPGYQAGDLAVTGTVETGLTLEFGGSLLGVDHPLLSVDTSGYVSGSPVVTITAVQDGSSNPDPLGGGEFLLFSKTFVAGASTGFADFQSGLNLGSGDPTGLGIWTYATATPGQGSNVPLSDISFDDAQIEIVEYSDFDPEANDDNAYTTQEDTPLMVGAAGDRSGDSVVGDFDPNFGVLNNDRDLDEVNNTGFTTLLRAGLVGDGTTSAGGQVVLNSDGTFTYTPPDNFNGVDTFQYIASDPGRPSPTAATVTINVTPVMDNPIATDDLYTGVPLNGSLDSTAAGQVGLLNNDSDGDAGDTNAQGIRIASVTTSLGTTAVPSNGTVVNLEHGTLTITNRETGDFTYTPDTDFIGIESFSYEIESFFTGTGVATGEPNASADVSIQVGLEPYEVRGFVYQDKNNNGVFEAGETGFGGVAVQLTGIDLGGGTVNATVVTNAAGEYRFQGILPGTYTLQEIQPTILQDGQETAGNFGDLNPLDNDRFDFNFTGGTDAVDYNFAELGRRPEYISVAELLASSSNFSTLVGFGATGQLQFYNLAAAGWEGITSLSIQLNGNGTATITATDDAAVPNTYQTTVATSNDPRFQIVLLNPGGLVVRLNGTRADFFG